jgi:DNA-binding transcriptional regulator GbsR (MarR family)
MDRVTGLFVDGMGAAAATSGILSQLQGRVFAFLYLQAEARSLDDIAAELQQSKSHVSVNMRGLIEWHLVRRIPVPGSRKDHYEAATSFWRVLQEVMERRFRWTVRQVLATLGDTAKALERDGGRAPDAFVAGRLAALRAFFTAVDGGIAAFSQG